MIRERQEFDPWSAKNWAARLENSFQRFRVATQKQRHCTDKLLYWCNGKQKYLRHSRSQRTDTKRTCISLSPSLIHPFFGGGTLPVSERVFINSRRGPVEKLSASSQPYMSCQNRCHLQAGQFLNLPGPTHLHLLRAQGNHPSLHVPLLSQPEHGCCPISKTWVDSNQVWSCQ